MALGTVYVHIVSQEHQGLHIERRGHAACNKDNQGLVNVNPLPLETSILVDFRTGASLSSRFGFSHGDTSHTLEHTCWT